ncbi:hypothetical protein B0A55_06330 [Friedmanniomyces simplex]|uniref:DUF7071 domain-containing protein n=1 Tax=Friedmanniomyces simplex TaxID=329884 RepID=A0A4U0X703_9PEZI|nr:hypothetical protein B0A55_06330 [Friedmanniomyces simplex]
MGYTSKFKRELDAEQQAHIATSEELGEALQVAQYLASKVESLRNVVATLAMGADLKIELRGYSEELERMERIVLARAASRLSEAPPAADYVEYAGDAHQAVMPPPPKSRKLGYGSSDAAVDLMLPFPSSDGLTVNPADIFSSDIVCPSDFTWATTYSDQQVPEPEPEPEPEQEFIDLEALERQLEAAWEVMGELAHTPVAMRILHKAEGLTREQLERMRGILEVDVEARTDMFVFADDLLG